MKLNSTLYLLLVGFTSSLLILGGSIYYTYKSEENLFSDFKAVEEANNLINDLDKISYLVNNLEKSYQSYELTHHNDVLATLNTDDKLLLYEIEKIHKKLTTGTIDSTYFLPLTELIKLRINTGRQKIATTSNSVNTILGQNFNVLEAKLKKEIRNKIDEINRNQKLLLSKGHINVVETLYSTHLNLAIVAFAAVVLTSLVFIFLWQYLKTHRKIEYDLLELNENKNKFFSIISHDLRGPVKNIVLMAQLLYQPANKTIDPEKIARLIESSANNLSSLLDNLLKWSRLQMNKIDFQPESIDLRKLSEDVIQNLGVHAEQKFIGIFNQIAPGTIVFADQNMIATVIRNLIYNALKFTNKGGKIEISSTKHSDYIEVMVVDSGVGMPKEIADKIFSIDFRHITKGTNKEEGTGLGLKLCKEFVEKNHGKIRVESEVGLGSKFIFTLPYKYLN